MALGKDVKSVINRTTGVSRRPQLAKNRANHAKIGKGIRKAFGVAAG